MRRKSYVYFFSAPGRIKIGVTGDVEKRRLSVGSHMDAPPTILGFVEGDFRLEKHLHEMLTAFRLRGEWFTDCVEVRNTMNILLAGGPDAVGFKPKAVTKPSLIQKKRTPEEWLAMFNTLVRIVYPDNTVEAFAESLEQPPDLCWAWLSGCEEIPLVIIKAFSSDLMAHLAEDWRRTEEARASIPA